MGKEYDKYPPLDNRRIRRRNMLTRGTLNLLAFFALGILIYLAFSALFDTPAEYKLRQSTETLRREYDLLSQRLEEVEGVLEDVEERDRNVFGILFESEPYDIDMELTAERWATLDEVMNMTNNELARMRTERFDHINGQFSGIEKTLDGTFAQMERLGYSVFSIPSIQPIVNKELTLLTASFGERIQPYYKVLTMHSGVDYTVPEGTRVFATADGTVKDSATRPSSTGTMVIIDHGNGYETRFHHLESVTVKKGQKVKRGDIIALTGNTGLSLIPHLHYEIWYNGKPIDPIHYFFAELTPQEYGRIIRIAQSGMQSFD